MIKPKPPPKPTPNERKPIAGTNLEQVGPTLSFVLCLTCGNPVERATTCVVDGTVSA